MPFKPYGKRAGGCFCLWPMIRYYQDKKKPVFFGPIFRPKKRVFLRLIFPRFFAKQSEGFLVFFSADFLRLAAAVFSVCRYKGVTAEHLLQQIGKKRVQGISERFRHTEMHLAALLNRRSRCLALLAKAALFSNRFSKAVRFGSKAFYFLRSVLVFGETLQGLFAA